MSFGSRLLHEVTIERLTTTGTEDEYGQPIRTTATIATVRALPQPKTIRELAQVNQAGAVVGDWTVYLFPMDLVEADRIVHDADTCPMPGICDIVSGTWEITGIRNAAGVGHHLEVDAKVVAGVPVSA